MLSGFLENVLTTQRGLVMSQRGTLYANDGVVTLGCRDGLSVFILFWTTGGRC